MLSQTKALHYTHKVQIVICEKCSPFCLFSFQADLDFHSRIMHPSKQHYTGSSIRHHCDWMWPSDDRWMYNDPAWPNNLELNILQFKANRQFFISLPSHLKLFSPSPSLFHTQTHPHPLMFVCLISFSPTSLSLAVFVFLSSTMVTLYSRWPFQSALSLF